jgi:hypothetical protein
MYFSGLALNPYIVFSYVVDCGLRMIDERHTPLTPLNGGIHLMVFSG